MSYIFVSYARTDASRIRTLVSRLEADLFEVRYDLVELLAGDDTGEALDRAIREASCVIVVWSAASVASQWVKAEAAKANDLGRLLPVLIDPVEPPLPFGQLHTVDLSNWDGDPNAMEFQSLEDAIVAVVGTPGAPLAAVVRLAIRRMELMIGSPLGWISTGDRLYKSEFLRAVRGCQTRDAVDCLVKWLATRATYPTRGPVLLVLLGVLYDKLPHEPGPGLRRKEIDENVDFLAQMRVAEPVSLNDWIPLLNAVASDCYS